MHALIDTLNVGDKVSLLYIADKGKPSKGYTGIVESFKQDQFTLKILNKGFRSFKFDKIFTIRLDRKSCQTA